MRLQTRCPNALVILALLIGLASGAINAAPLTFAAMGDGPRNAADWPKLAEQIFNKSSTGKSRFLIHLGDITNGTDRLPEWHYAGVAALLRASLLPVYIVPGDNEWNDLENPAEGWAFWENYFLHFEQTFEDAPITEHQESHPPNFAFIQDGVLIIGLNLVGGTVHDPAEWRRRHAHNVDWVRTQLKTHKDAVHAAVICAQARPNPMKHADFFDPIKPLMQAFEKPILYLHGDGHTFEVEEAFLTPNAMRVQVDQVSKAPPLLVTVSDDPEKPFQFDRQLLETALSGKEHSPAIVTE